MPDDMMQMNRRHFLTLAGASASLSLFSPRLLAADPATAPRFIFFILRGGMDGLSAVPMSADPAFTGVRGPLGAGDIRPLALEGGFGLHPALATLHKLYKAREAVVFHAVAAPYRTRSHFDAQDMLEQGAAVQGTRNGFLARLLETDERAKAVALAETMPLALRGSSKATSWAPTLLPDASADIFERLDDLYAGDPLLEAALVQARDAEAVAGGTMGGMKDAGRGNVTTLAEAAARFLAKEGGPTIAMLEFGGWDTHAGQIARLDRQFSALDKAIATLREGLGETWQHTAIVIATEFGRTVAVNGTRGTDHGTAGAAFLLGGAVKGGRVMADWPGLTPVNLHEGRDLRPTLDLRAVFKGVMGDHLKIASARLDRDIFPDSATVKPLAGLLIG